MKSIVAGTALILTALAIEIAEAGGPAPVPGTRNPAFAIEGRQTWATDPKAVFGPEAQPPAKDSRDRDGDGRPDGRPVHPYGRHPRPSTVIVAPGPVYVAPSPCWSAGYWNYQWIPQAYTYNLWVPGQWAPNGAWIDGHYEPRVHQSGYWQPYWVEGRYVAC